MDHDILFSNEDFMKGFIVGYWNGDGHVRDTGAFGGCVNQSLFNKVRLILSYFGIGCSLNYATKEGTYRMNITGNNFRKFMAEFYDIVLPLPKYKRKQNLVNDGEKTMCPIIKSSLEDYDGYVYNLEVEGDSSYSTLNATVHNCFAKDSAGFFKRTLIESCVAKEKNVNAPNWPEWCPDPFDVTMRGQPNKKYVMGIDPASEIDNFALIILELHLQHQRVVYSWTTNKKDFNARKKLGLTDIDDYYSFVVRKIRDLMQVFPTVAIGIDSQGGGYQIAEGLRDSDKIRTEY